MASSTKIVPNLQAPTSQPTMIPQPPEDPLLTATLACLAAMDPMFMARSGGQILYDIVLSNPTEVIGGPENLGRMLKFLLINPDGTVNKDFYPLISRYIKDSLVGRDPVSCCQGICKIITLQLYASGKMIDGHQENPPTSA